MMVESATKPIYYGCIRFDHFIKFWCPTSYSVLYGFWLCSLYMNYIAVLVILVRYNISWMMNLISVLRKVCKNFGVVEIVSWLLNLNSE